MSAVEHRAEGGSATDPARVRSLLHGVREGRLFDLAQPVSSATPHLAFQPQYRLRVDQMRLSDVMPSDLETDVFAEHVEMTLHTGTHVDALGHFAADGHWCHGVEARAPVAGAGIGHHGIETLDPIFARAVVLDVATWSGVDVLDGGTRITADMLDATAKAQGVGIEHGDVVLVRTGWGRHYGTDNARYVSSEPGIDEDAARRLSAQGAIAVGADTMALEMLPFAEERRVFPVHRHLLAEAGVHIIENLRLDDVCAARIYAAVFVLLPVRFVGGTASPATPMMIV